MNNDTLASGNLLRTIGLMSVAVGIAWAIQIIGFGPATGVTRLLWVLAAAAISGAGVGLVVVSLQLPQPRSGAPVSATA